MANGAEIAGGVAQSAPLIPALIGKGMNKRTATGFYNQPGYDPNASNFGGYAGGLDDYRRQQQNAAGAADARGAFQANYGQADQYAGLGLDARNQQGTVAQMMLARAQGKVPSIAQMQADRQMGQAVSAQGALAASARGAGGMALAGQTRANNVANVQSGISNQAQINAAAERERAEGNAFGAASGMRGQDLGAQQAAAQQAQFQAGLQQANRNANDARAMGHNQLEGQALGQSLGAKVANQGQLGQSYTTAEVANQQTAGQNAQSKGLISTIDDFFSDERAKVIYSDFTTKMPALLPGGGAEGAMARAKGVSGGSWETGGFGAQGMPGMSGPAAESFAGQQGMLGGSPMGELKAHSDFATRFTSDPTGGMAGGFMSDAKVKEKAFADGVEYGQRVAATEQRMKAEGGPTFAAAMDAARAYIEADKKPKIPIVNKGDPGTTPDAPDGSKPREMKSFQRDQAVPPTVSAVDRDYAPAVARQIAIAGGRPMMAAADPMIVSDFTAKMPSPAPPGQKLGLTRGGLGGDPGAPKMQFSASTGWYLPQAPDPNAALSAEVDDEMRAMTEESISRDERSRLAAQGNASDPMAQWQKSFGDPEVAKTQASFDARNQGGGSGDSNALEARKIRAGFAKDNASGAPAPSYLGALSSGSKGLYEAQFGSDFTTKEAVDKAELGEIQRMRSPVSFKRDTPEDQARVKKAFYDRAGKDADAMLAGYERSLNEGASVNVPDTREPMRAKNPNDGPYRDPDGNTAEDEDFSVWDSDNVEAKNFKPSRSPVAQANRTMVGAPYVYKPQFTPPDQKPGEPNFGFMAQNLEKSPITATAVKEDAAGLKRVDALKLLRILGASVADLQRQEDETRMVLSKGGKKAA